MLLKLSELKNLIGDQSLARIFEIGLNAALVQEQKKRGMIPNLGRTKAEELLAKTQSAGNIQKKPVSEEVLIAKASRFIPIEFKRVIFQRSQGRCEFIPIPKRDSKISSSYR